MLTGYSASWERFLFHFIIVSFPSFLGMGVFLFWVFLYFGEFVIVFKSHGL